MKVCIPIARDYGLESTVYGHFGSAPQFVVADTETGEIKPLDNRDRDHQHGRCSPLQAIAGEKIDAVVVGGIGAKALQGLWACVNHGSGRGGCRH